MDYQKLINSNIKELRLKNGLTQEEFAEKIGISIQGVSNIERNRYQPTADTVNKICKTFKITPLELLMTKSKTNNELFTNITSLLANCSHKNLKIIYDVVLAIIKNN